jgi:hypothetical protein
MSNPQWREVYPGRPEGEPGAGPRYRDPGTPGTGWQDPRGFDPRWQDPRRSGGDPVWRDPRRSGGDPVWRDAGGSGLDPQWRAPGAGDPRTGGGTRRIPTQPGATQPVPAQTSASRPRPVQPGADQPASGRPDELRGGQAGQSRNPREPRGLGRWGSLPGWLGVCVVIASAAIGAVATVLARTAPGHLLGVCIVVGTVVAALAVRPTAGRLLFPVPALFYLIAALASGIAYDRAADSSKTALAINATQWIADGFFAMVIATALVVVLITVRWYIWRRRSRAAAAPGWPQGDTEEIAGRADRLGPRQWDDPGQRPQGPPGYPGPGPRPSWRPDPRTDPPPGPGPYNFSSGA